MGILFALALAAVDFRVPVDRILPQTESYQLAVFSGAVSGIPRGAAIDRVSAPPLAAILGQQIEIVDQASGAVWRSGTVNPGLAPGAVWQPGKLLVKAAVHGLELEAELVALRRVQGFVLRYRLRNPGAAARAVTFATLQAPSVRRPPSWGYGPQYRALAEARYVAPGRVEAPLAVYANSEGAVAFGMTGASGGAGTALRRRIELAPGARREIDVVFVVDATAEAAAACVRSLLGNPAQAAAEAEAAFDADIAALFARLPALDHPDPRVMRFYRTSAVQLLYARWRLPGKLFLDPWYATLGLDSGGMNCYFWDANYSRVALALADPKALRAMLLAFVAAPMSEHYSIDPIDGRGGGPFYSYSPYSYVAIVDEYLRVTGDRSLLKEVRAGKPVLEWLVAMAELGERDRDSDGNGLVDYGDDHNLLEIKTTGAGPGYIHEVPSPNGERAYCYDTVADILAEEDAAGHRALIERFHASAAAVRRAVNEILWQDGPGWYGTRQKDGTVVPVYSIQVFDLLRVPGLVPRERALRLAGHLNDDEFLGPFGVRSLSRKDRLWDWRDHDWSGPMSYIGDGPQLVADFFEAGLVEQAWKAWERILWWPEHLAIWPQGVANDDYTPRVPAAAPFGGRISAGLTSEISGSTGVEAVVRGLFGVRPGRDGSIGFGAGRRAGDGAASLSYPYRGRVWKITQRREGLEARRDDGLEASLSREDGRLRFALPPKAVVVDAGVREKGGGRLEIGLPFLLRQTGARRAAELQVNVAGRAVKPRVVRGRLVMDLTELTREGVRIEIRGR